MHQLTRIVFITKAKSYSLKIIIFMNFKFLTKVSCPPFFKFFSCYFLLTKLGDCKHNLIFFWSLFFKFFSDFKIFVGKITFMKWRMWNRNYSRMYICLPRLSSILVSVFNQFQSYYDTFSFQMDIFNFKILNC